MLSALRRRAPNNSVAAAVFPPLTPAEQARRDAYERERALAHDRIEARARDAAQLNRRENALQRALRRNEAMRQEKRFRKAEPRAPRKPATSHRAVVAVEHTLSSVVWLLVLLVATALLGGMLLMSEGARTAIGFESVGNKLDRKIATANGVLADAGESVRDRVGAVSDKVENTGRELNNKSIAVFDAGAARVDAVRSGVGDAAITASIKADLLKDPYLSARRINVDTVEGEVILTGEARSEASRERAGRMAQSIAGVKKVDNRLVVAGG